jgi:hypothetical protein
MKSEYDSDMLTQVYKLRNNGNTKGAVQLLKDLEQQRLLYPKVLVLQYLYLITTDFSNESLSDLENILMDALKIDDNYLPALVELAYLKLVVQNNPGQALPLFEKANEIARSNITETVIGQAQCIAELQSSEAAIAFLEDQKEKAIDPDKLQEFRDTV